jgi:hypothetical protein
MVREGKHSGIDDDTRTRARRFAEDAGMPKPAVTGRALPKQRVVSKKELEDSGLSLRDFLNRERGLTRRGMSVADAKKQLNLGEKPSASAVMSAKQQLGLGGSSGIDSTALDRNYVRRDMKDRMDVIDRETQGDFLTAMKQKPRRDPGTSGAVGGDYMAESAKSRRVRNMYERGAEETNAKGMKKGGMTASKRADGCAVRGKTRA